MDFNNGFWPAAPIRIRRTVGVDADGNNRLDIMVGMATSILRASAVYHHEEPLNRNRIEREIFEHILTHRDMTHDALILWVNDVINALIVAQQTLHTGP